MARRTPPNYAADGEAVYIPADDSAWDTERIAREREEHEAKDAEHPVDRYLSGATRCRLSADVLEYLDMGKEPEQWKLRELPPLIRRQVDAHMYRAYRLISDGKDAGNTEVINAITSARLLAFKHGVGNVENWGFDFPLGRTSDGAISDKTISGLDMAAPGLVDEIGECVRQAFRALDPDEGK